MTTSFQFECAAARRLVHALADGELDAAGRSQLEAHLGACAECRAFRDEIGELRAALAGLDDPELPAEDLAAMFARTIGAASTAAPRRRRRAPAWAAAGLAAAALGIALLAPVARRAPADAPPTEAELARAASDIRYVFRLTDRAVHESGRTAVGEAVTRGVRPALRRVPLFDSPLTGGVTP